MFRPSPTCISLPDHEIYQILQEIHHLYKAKATVPLPLSESDSDDYATETDIEDYSQSPSSFSHSFTWSSSPGQYNTGIRLNDSRVPENHIPARLYARLNSKRDIQSEGSGRGDASTSLSQTADPTDSLSSATSPIAAATTPKE